MLISACQDGDRTISAQPAGVADLAGGGFSQEGLDAIQEMMDTAVADGRISAGIAMEARDGKIPWLGTAGEMEPGIPMQRWFARAAGNTSITRMDSRNYTTSNPIQRR